MFFTLKMQTLLETPKLLEPWIHMSRLSTESKNTRVKLILMVVKLQNGVTDSSLQSLMSWMKLLSRFTTQTLLAMNKSLILTL